MYKRIENCYSNKSLYMNVQNCLQNPKDVNNPNVYPLMDG